MAEGFKRFRILGMAIDPIHVGTGGARLGRVDLSIVRDPVTRVPKIPGSSLAGVHRAYAAMARDRYPRCAGQGRSGDGRPGHCAGADCEICTVFGFARGDRDGFAGLAAFSDAHVLLFPLATWEGPMWLTCPGSLRLLGYDVQVQSLDDALYREGEGQPLNLGWILLDVKPLIGFADMRSRLESSGVPPYTANRAGVVSDKLFSHLVNSNLEVRTSVSIAPETGAAEEGALFTYEALPRSTVLVWDLTCRDPRHFKAGGSEVEAVKNVSDVFDVVSAAHPYLEHLGIGGMGTRGMGRLRVLSNGDGAAAGGM
jgi:CRISPR-associated protein Cmr4